MRKIDLIHTTILIVAILAGYQAIDWLIYMLSLLSYGSDVFYLRETVGHTIVQYLITAVLYGAACWILIKNGRKYASTLLRDEPSGSWDDTILWQLDKKRLLLVLFIGMGIYILLQTIPLALEKLYDAFKDKLSPDSVIKPSYQKESLTVELLRITLGAFLVYTAPTLSEFFDNSGKDKPVPGSAS